MAFGLPNCYRNRPVHCVDSSDHRLIRGETQITLIASFLGYRDRNFEIGIRLRLQCLAGKELFLHNGKPELSRRMMQLYVNCPYHHIAWKKGPSRELWKNFRALSTIAFDQYIKSALSNLLVYGVVALSIAGLLFMPDARAVIDFGHYVSHDQYYLGAGSITKGRLLKASEESNIIFSTNATLHKSGSIGAITETKVFGKEEFFLDQFATLEKQAFSRRALQDKMSVIPASCS